jgi:putative addiction module component (TIGR02574 family)
LRYAEGMALDKDTHGLSDAASTPADVTISVGIEDDDDARWHDDEEELTPEEHEAMEAEAVKECRRRLDDYRAGRTTAAPWEEVKARLLARLG